MLQQLALLKKKKQLLKKSQMIFTNQKKQISNPDHRVLFSESNYDQKLLSDYAQSYWGIGSGDVVRFTRQFWEIPRITKDWSYLQGTFSESNPYTGRDQIIYWQEGKGVMVQSASELGNRPTRGYRAWNKKGIAISQMGGLSATLYTGEIFQNGVAAIIPNNSDNIPAIWAYCSSQEFVKEVRKLDQKLCVTNLTLIKVPFDIKYWTKVAVEAGTLPAPFTTDPTQWLFLGNLNVSKTSLHVIIPRLLGYEWPKQTADLLSQ